MAPSHTNTHTVRGSPTAKKEIRRFQNGLVRELKVTEERKLLRQSKTLCLNRRHQFVQSEDYTSYMEKRFAKGMFITLKSEGIWTIEEDCSKSNSKRKRCSICVVCRPTDRLSTRGRRTQLSSFRKGCDRNHYPCSSFGFV